MGTEEAAMKITNQLNIPDSYRFVLRSEILTYLSNDSFAWNQTVHVKSGSACLFYGRAC